jgi:hypothetical protein
MEHGLLLTELILQQEDRTIIVCNVFVKKSRFLATFSVNYIELNLCDIYIYS